MYVGRLQKNLRNHHKVQQIRISKHQQLNFLYDKYKKCLEKYFSDCKNTIIADKYDTTLKMFIKFYPVT